MASAQSNMILNFSGFIELVTLICLKDKYGTFQWKIQYLFSLIIRFSVETVYAYPFSMYSLIFFLYCLPKSSSLPNFRFRVLKVLNVVKHLICLMVLHYRIIIFPQMGNSPSAIFVFGRFYQNFQSTKVFFWLQMLCRNNETTCQKNQ